MLAARFFIPVSGALGFAAMALPLYLYPLAVFDPIEGGSFYETAAYRSLFIPYAAAFTFSSFGLLAGKAKRFFAITLCVSFLASHAHFKFVFGEALVFKPLFSIVFIVFPAFIFLLGARAAFLIFLLLIFPFHPAFAVLAPEEKARFEKNFLEQVNVKAELAPPDIKRNAFAKECAAVYTVRQVHGQPADLGLTRGDKIRLVYPCDETLRPSHVGSFLPWASAWPGESIWMTVPRNYLKSESKHYWVLDNSGKVLAPVRLPAEKFNCPETDYPLTNERERPSGEIYYDVQAQGIRNASVYCRYAKGQYELYIYWYLNSSAITEPPACFNEGSAYHEIKDAPIPVQHVRTYYTKEEFGIDVNEEGGRFWVAHAEKHSPAFDAGIKSGERILKIGGQDLTGKKLSEVLALLKGYEEKEKKAVFGFQNQNENPRDVTLEIAPYDFFGDQMVVYAKGKWARVELQLDPDEPITEAMKAYWIGVSRQILEGLKEEALACR